MVMLQCTGWSETSVGVVVLEARQLPQSSPKPTTVNHTTTQRCKYAHRWFSGVIQVAPLEAVTLTPLIYPANSFRSVGW